MSTHHILGLKKDNMLFTHEKNADQFDLLSYGNLRGLDASGNSEESSFGNGCKDNSSVSLEKFSFPWLPVENCQPATLDHDKRTFSDVKSCQVACKRPKQTDHNTWLNSLEECPFISEAEISASALADELIEIKQPDHNPASNGATTCSVSSDIHCPNHKQSVGVENLQLPDWVTSFPGYSEDCETIAGYNQVGDIDSPVHEYLPRKGVPIGPEHQADIPEWRPRVSVSVTGGSGFCADLECSSVSTSEPVSRGYDCESAKWWIKDSVIPISFCSSPVDWVRDNKIDCDCSDEGSVRCVRQHIIEARENLKMSLGQDKFCELGLSEMGEDIAQRWTDEEEKLFQRVVFSNPISLGKNFWDHLPHAFPSKTSKDLVSYYFNVFMLRKRAQQNRSDLLRVDSDDDELHGESLVAGHEEEDSAVESPKHEHFIDNSLPIEGAHKEYGEHITRPSFHENAIECRYLPNQMPLYSNAENITQNVCDQDELRASFESQHNRAAAPKGVQCAEYSLNDAPRNQGASV